MSAGKRDGWFLALLSAFVLALLAYRHFFAANVPIGRDLLFYFLPLKAHIAEALRNGEVPWIDRYRWGGAPLLGAPGSAPFDPGNVLFVVLPLAVAVKVWTLSRLLLAIAGFALFARRWGLSWNAASVAGLVYGLGGVSISLAPFLGAHTAHAILPWFACFVLDAVRRTDRRSFASLAASTALLLVASCPEYVLYAVIVAMALLTVRGSEADAPTLRRAVLSLALAALAGALLAGPAVLPAISTAVRSARGPGGGTNLEFAGEGSLAVVRLKDLLADGLVADWSEVLSVPGLRMYPYLPSITPGRVAWLLVLAGLFAKGRARWAALSLCVVGVLLALGPATPVWILAARAVPLLRKVRFPEKHVILAGFGFAWLALLGLGLIERWLGGMRPVVWLCLLVATWLDRDRIARDLSPTADASIVEVPPPALRGLSPGDRDAPPLRLFTEDAYRETLRFPGGVRGATLGPVLFLAPEYPSLFGFANQLERDYDLTLPRQAFEWTRLVPRVLSSRKESLLRFLRAVGVGAVESGEVKGDRLEPVLRPVESRVPPFRFASRVVADANARHVYERLLAEGFDPDTAYVPGLDSFYANPSPAESSPSAIGRTLSVSAWKSRDPARASSLCTGSSTRWRAR